MSEIIVALTELFKAVVQVYGATNSAIIFIIIVFCFLIWRLYSDRKKDKEISLIVAEKERTIQRIAEECKQYKIIVFKEKFNWSDEMIENYIISSRLTYMEEEDE